MSSEADSELSSQAVTRRQRCQWFRRHSPRAPGARNGGSAPARRDVAPAWSPSGYGSEPGQLRSSLTGPDWLTGGQFGVEGSIIALMVDVVASTLLLWLAKKRGHLIA
ncbi:MAG: hypothetical protein ACSLE8_23865 [Rhodococcus sp. (in: high G+C Gram-positive bacteria)]